MLILFTGGDIEGLRKEIEKRVSSFKKTGSDIVRITDVNFSPELVSSHFGGSDLFGRHSVIFLDRLSSNAAAREFLFNSLTEFSDSLNDFLVLEEKLLSDDVTLFEKAGGEVVSRKSGTAKPKQDFNIFALADALGNRDRKNLWTLYTQALRAGKTPEEISGTLFWQVKSMLQVAKGDGTSLNPFVKSKAARFIKNYSETELEKLAYELVSEYHESRRGGLPLEGRLERVILGI